MKTKSKILVVLGPTATGKSDIAVKLARKFGGEIISADSRQVYKGLDIGTGKITKREMRGVRHHLLDVVSPKKVFTVSQFKALADKAISEIISRGKIPIICGGTGFYIQAVVDGVIHPDVPPNQALRKKLEKKSLAKLNKILKKLDPVRAKSIDSKNPRRIIRAIEIATDLGKVPKIKADRKYDVLQIGINTTPEDLKNRISIRLKKRIKAGMISEARRLRRDGLSSKRMEALGLEYRSLARHLQGEISKEEMVSELETAIWQFSRRQITWFKKDKRVKWFGLKEATRIQRELFRFLYR